MRTIARTPQSTLTCTMRSSEHAAHRLLMHMCSHIALVAQGLALCVIHIIHACAPVFGLLSVVSSPVSLYFFFKSFFHLFLMSALMSDEISMEDPLCDSSFGSMVTLDYVTPDIESEWSLLQPHDSFPDAGEAINDFWSMSGSFIYRHHVEPRVKLYSPREESFPIPLKYIDVTRTTHTNLDVKQEKRIDDYWNIDGSRDFCLILGQVSHNLLYSTKKLLTDILGPGGD